MDYLTLHELSLKLDISVRVLRHRLRHLLTAGKLVEGRDCRRDGFVDETHFTWRVDPVAFIRVAGLRPVTNLGNHRDAAANRVDIPPTTTVSEPATRSAQTLPNVDRSFPAIGREMIDLLKGQLSAKDGQIADLSEQNKKLNDMNLKLVAQTVQQSDRIQTLLRLTEGKMELADMVTMAGSGTATTDSNPGDHMADTGSESGNQSPSSSSRGWGSELAA